MRVVALTFVLCLRAAAARAQPESTVFPHPPDRPFWISGQINLIEQAHGAFPSPYSGPQSFRSEQERRVSSVITLYTGVRLRSGWEIIFDLESAGGRGLSDAFGLAGFTDLDVVRNPSLGAAPYLARLFVRKVIALSDDQTRVTPGPLSLAPALPSRRLEIRAGKLGIVDFFDQNSVGGDSHLQFTNWAIDNNAAYDYAADTRGYTYGLIVEYDTPRWSLRGAEALMPKVANGIVLDWDVASARGENVEIELRPTSRWTARLLAYVNHANMGSYDEAIAAFRAGREPVPDIVAHRRHGRVKEGVGVNVECAVSEDVRVFGRAGWNEGHHESFAYTEANDTVSGGGDLAGSRWHRPRDRAGVAFASNGLSEAHREYLQLGGLGFLLGDGTLSYGRENIVEGYYTAQVWRGLFVSAGVQYIRNPGYNVDRGPILVQDTRVHVEF